MDIAIVLVCPEFVWYGACKLSLATTDTMNQEAMRMLTHQLTLRCFKANLLLHATFNLLV